jgi:hypothetical protein
VLMELMRHESIDTTMKYYVGRNAERTADAAWAAYEAVNARQGGVKNPGPVNTFVNTEPFAGSNDEARNDASPCKTRAY